jgi:phage-related baseplate assembly protein
MADNNSVSYLNKSFSDFKANLVEYAKTYFPTTYNDFSEASPGNMFIEMASYVGDVMSFYLDTQVQENFLLYAKEKENLYALSYMLGYRPKATYAAVTTIDIYQQIPTSGSGANQVPDYTYATIIPENTVLTANGYGTKFLTTDKVDFTDTGSTDITYYSSNYFLLKKQVQAISAEIKSTTINITAAQKFQIATISDTNILQILDATDIGGNKWYEVPYLAQSTVFDKIANPSYGTDGVPYLLQLKRVPRRYVSRFLSDNSLQLEFGAGISTTKTDNVILPTPNNINLGLVPGISNLYKNFNEASVFYTQEYGLAPSSNITVRYLVGGGLTANTNANTITTIDTSGVQFPNLGAPDAMSAYILTTVAATNPIPASGGRSGDQIEEVRNNALNAYQSQLRAVTREDYMVRALSLSTEYGSIAKVYVTQDPAREMIQTATVATIEERNPLSLDMFILGYNGNKNLTNASTVLKQNLATYIDQFRMVTDAINIKDAFYINIGINFDVTVKSGYNNNTIITNCITALQNYFNIEKWNINQPIVISDVQSQILQIDGVQAVVKLEFVNKYDSTGVTYSKYGYDISGATRSRNIYPSLDPSIFEVRYPNTDIQGRVVFV